LEFAVCFNKSASFLGLCSDNKRKGYHDGWCSSPSQTQTRTRTAASQSGGRTRWWGVPTSGAFGHILGCAIALGYIWIAEQGLDAMLSTGGFEIEIACQRFPAQATLEAAYDSENLKPRM
jgi:glycine cleavage system aminomethyltransferase T